MMGYRTTVPQSQTLVGNQQPLATDSIGIGNLDANPLNRLDSRSVTRLDH